MAGRTTSPFNPARRALLEPIWQPLYTSALLAQGAAGPAQVVLFPVPAASQADTLLAYPGIVQALASPKMFTVVGIRLHVCETTVYCYNVALVASQFVADLKIILENYRYHMRVGEKDYLHVPAFWVPSGMGVTGCIAIGAAIGYEQAVTNGISHHENYAKLKGLPITIPPQQQFACELVGGIAGVPIITQTRRIYTFWEGKLGREVQ